MIRKIFLVTFILVVIVPVYSQRLSDGPSSYSPAKSSFSLFDPNRFSMSHSYSFMYSSSKTGSQSLGMYLNSIEYQVADPLKIKLDIGYLHRPGSFLSSGGSTSNKGVIVPSFSINWKPSKNILFRFDYQQAPSSLYYLNPGLSNLNYNKGEDR